MARRHIRRVFRPLSGQFAIEAGGLGGGAATLPVPENGEKTHLPPENEGQHVPGRHGMCRPRDPARVDPDMPVGDQP